MFPIPVPTTRPTTREALDEMIDKLDNVFRDVRARAFESFLRRGESLGSDLEDWFAAERELFLLPKSEVKETETEIQIRAAVPGFKAEDLHVQVLPELIVIEAKTPEPPAPEPKPEKPAEKVIFSEFAAKRLFRQYKLGCRIDVDNVTAVIDHGVLSIVARKAAAENKPIDVPVRGEGEVVVAPPVALAATAK